MRILSERCNRLREEAVNTKSLSRKIGTQQEYWFRFGMLHLDAEKRSNTLLNAAGIASVVENATPVIQEGEWIVGYNFGDGGYEWLSGNQEQDTKLFQENGFTDEQIQWYYDSFNAPQYTTSTPIKEDFTQQEWELLAEGAALNSAGRSSITSNHSVIGYERVVKLGFEGLLEEVNAYATKNGDCDFYEGLRMVCRAGSVCGERYAEKAKTLNTPEGKRIVETCSQVPRKPARTFLEAVQSIWFAHIMNTWEDGINANSLGRLDQILYPYYKKDMESGILTKEDAFEIICCFWIKLYRDYDVQQSCVGGHSVDGSSEVNELSYLMLDATEALDFIRCLSVRFDAHTEKAFLQRALEVVGHVGKGIPFFFNDDVMIPALVQAGISYEDAVGYTQIGCVETVIPGKSNPHAVNSRCNLLKAMEYTLGNGHSLFAPERTPGLSTGDPLTFDTFDELKKAVFAQMKHLLKATVKIALTYMPSSEADFPKPVKSLLTEGCMEQGKDFNARGAKYDYYQLMLMGIPNLADSLAAIQELVYDRKKYTMGELLYQLENDYPDEAVRLDFLHKAPKFGNDNDVVDSLAFEITDFACDYIHQLSDECGRSFHPQPFTFVWMIEQGKLTAATPDGRHRGEIFAYSVSPMQGRDGAGLTALFHSLAKLPTKKTPGTTSAIVEIEPDLFCDRNIHHLVDVLQAAASEGLCNVQFNTVDAQTLEDAQIHPENHRNLAVRVSGYSQKFNLLTKDLQNHIIARTKHPIL